MNYLSTTLISVSSTLLIFMGAASFFLGLFGVYGGLSAAFKFQLELNDGLLFLLNSLAMFLLNAYIWRLGNSFWPALTFRRGILLGSCCCWLLAAFWYSYWCLTGVTSESWDVFVWCQVGLLGGLIITLPLIVIGFIRKKRMPSSISKNHI